MSIIQGIGVFVLSLIQPVNVSRHKNVWNFVNLKAGCLTPKTNGSGSMGDTVQWHLAVHRVIFSATWGQRRQSMNKQQMNFANSVHVRQFPDIMEQKLAFLSPTTE